MIFLCMRCRSYITSSINNKNHTTLYRLLEEMANTVYESHTNEHVLLKFLTDLHAMLDHKTVWGGHLGSETLMRRHKNTRTRIACITVLEKRRTDLEQRKSEESGTSLQQLPEEVESRES